MRRPLRYAVIDDSAILGTHRTLKAAKETLRYFRNLEKRDGYDPSPSMAIYELVARKALSDEKT